MINSPLVPPGVRRIIEENRHNTSSDWQDIVSSWSVDIQCFAVRVRKNGEQYRLKLLRESAEKWEVSTTFGNMNEEDSKFALALICMSNDELDPIVSSLPERIKRAAKYLH